MGVRMNSQFTRLKFLAKAKFFQSCFFSIQRSFSEGMKQTVEHEFYDTNWKKSLLWKLLISKKARKKLPLQQQYFKEVIEASPVPKISAQELFQKPLEITLSNSFSRNGNVSEKELMVLASLARSRAPKRILEIGTFDGNTTLQLALNTPSDAIIHTLDLPPDAEETAEPVLKSDLTFIHDQEKLVRKFEGSRVAHKIVQHLGDSTALDFSMFTAQGPLNMIFIDGGHSYPCVKSDTENALEVLADGGCILWHDFTPFFGGVYRFLLELSKTLPLIHIEGTHLIIYQKGESQ